MLLGIHLNKTIIQKDANTPVFTAALLTIAKIWKQPKCPLMEEWIKNMPHICPWDCPGKKNGAGYHFLLQGIFLTQGSNLSPLASGFFTPEPPREPRKDISKYR